MNMVTVAAIQMSAEENRTENLTKAEKLVRQAAADGANVILLPELFERKYFCQERSYDFYSFAEPVSENKAVSVFREVAAELGVVIPISFYEKSVNSLYNSVAMINSDGELLGVYRKTHIPDDHFYQEKFYFSPGNTGFKVWDTAFGKIGVGICWDQWFPEAARAMALLGAELILYPTAIGSEPILGCDSSAHWRRCMQGHSAANLVPIIAANRVGTETVLPSDANNNQSSSLSFYGRSFMTDNIGEIIQAASDKDNCIIKCTYDLDKLNAERLEWGVFRDRRGECYGLLTK